MSLPLLRHTRLSQSLAATRRLASRSRRYSASPVLAEARREPEQRDDDAQVAGPSSSQPASSVADTNTTQAPLKGAQKPSDFTRVQSYLASINASGLEPTREDLERCRPLHQPSPHSPQYTETYTTLINNLCRSFTKEQLRKFLAETLGMSRHSGSHRKKVEYAESIVEQLWGWPTLKELEKAKRDRTEVSIQTFPVSASDLFLFLGPDGTDLLRISKDFDVHISLRREPMALQVEGSRGALREVAERLLILKKSFVEEAYDLPFPVAIPPDMVQRISRLASAYLENVPSTPGKLKIVAKGEEGISSAKRLASRAVYEIEESLHTPILTYIPPGAAATHVEQLVMFPHDYALFPYLSPRPLPFTMNTSGTFRLRRAAQWLAADFRERIEHTGGLQGGKGHILTGPEEEGNLKSVLLRGLPSAGQPDQPPIVVKASMGHMLLTRPSGEQRATLVPPLTGAHPFGKVRKWIAQNPVKMTFVPDLPLPLLDVSPLNQSTKHRLVYHALGGGADGASRESSPKSSSPVRRRKVISLEVTLTKPAAAPQEPRDTMLERDLEEGLSALDFDGSPQALSAYPALPRVPQIPVLNTAGVHCWTGVEADLNLMMPNRPMDLQFTVRSATELAEARQPAELQQYVAQLRAYLKGTDLEADYPSPPLLIENDGERYILHSNTSVRQSEELVSDDVQPTSVDFNPAMEDVTPTRAVCESTLDLETSQKSMHCEVTCPDASSEEAWTQFLRDCDRLSLLREPPPKLYSALQDTQQWTDREMDGDDIL